METVKMEKSKTVEFINSLKENKTKIFTTLGILLLFVIFAIFVYARIQSINNEASDKLNTASQLIATGNAEQGMIIIDDLIKNYRNTPSAYRAMIMRASNLMYEKKYEQAEAMLKDFIANAKPEIIRPMAYPLLITIYDDNKNTAQAIAVSKEFLAKYSDNYLAESVKKNLERLTAEDQKVESSKGQK